MDSQEAFSFRNKTQTDALTVERITVKRDRIVCEVGVSDVQHRYTNEQLIARVCRVVPHLPGHTCKNAQGLTFSAVMNQTSLPHLLEHMVIALQAKDASDAAKIFVGTTEWLDEQAGLARVEVSFTDDLDALRAFRVAVQILNEVMI